MTPIYRIARLAALTVSGACCLVGCQQLQTITNPNSGGYSNTSSTRDANLTSAQQADMQIAMGRVSERQGDLAAAMTAYTEAVKRDASRSDAYVRMAVVHDRQGEFRESADLYRQALKLSPGSPDVYCDMGYSLYLQRRWAEAEMNLRQAIALDHKHARSHNNLALVLAQNGRTNDALAEFHMGGSDHASAHANLAFVLTMANRLDLARAEYQHALAANPSSSELKVRIQQLDSLAAKLTPTRDKIAATQDPRVMTASAEIAPQPPSPTRVSSPQPLAVDNSSPARPLSGPVPGHSHSPLPIDTAHVTRGGTTSPAPATIPASKALAAPQAVLAANASKPVASISRQTTQHAATKPQLAGSGRPSALLPPTVNVKARGAAQTYSTRPGSSHPVIPPPKPKLLQTVEVHEPAQRRAIAPARTQSIPPPKTNVPGAVSAANNAPPSQFSASPSLESAR